MQRAKPADLAEAIERACERRILSFYSALDGKRYEELASHFTEDGVWHRLGTPLRGPSAILAAMQGRQNWTTVHVVSNLLVTALSSSEARSEEYVTIYRHEAGDDEKPPFPVSAPVGLSIHRDRLELTGAGWKFVEKTSATVMVDTSRVHHHTK